MTTLQVKLGTRSYPIYIDSGLLSNSDLLSSHIRSKRVCIVSNDIVAPLYIEQLKHSLKNFDVDEIVLPDLLLLAINVVLILFKYPRPSCLK